MSSSPNMPPSQNGPATPPVRPSLTTGPSRAAQPPTPATPSILEALESGDKALLSGSRKSPQRRSSSWLAASVVGMLAVAAAAIWWTTGRDSATVERAPRGVEMVLAPKSAAPPAAMAALPVEAPTTVARSQTPAPILAQTPTQAPTQASTPPPTARLETMPPAVTISAPNAALTAAAPALIAPTAAAALDKPRPTIAAAAPTATQTTAATNPLPTVVSKRAAPEVEIARAAAASPALNTAPTNKVNPVGGAPLNFGPTATATATTTAAAPSNVGTKPALRSGDPDVDLMAALMVHMNSTRAGADALAAPTKSSAMAKPAGTQVAALGDLGSATIASLVARCEKLVVAEANQCRRRICKGSWGKADACPVAETKAKGKTSLKDKKRKQAAKRSLKSASLLAPTGFAAEATAPGATASTLFVA